jgi:ribose transport system ATP-binding protein
MVPEDRKQQGLLLLEPLRVNTTLATLDRHTSAGGWLSRRSETRKTEELCGKLNVRRFSWEQPIWELSGGNQQKVVIARWLARDCQVLLFDEPTRGIDVAAKDAIYTLIRELAAAGRTVIVASSDLPELMSLCDRILVMSAGKLAGEFLPHNWSQEKITRAAFSEHLQTSGGKLAVETSTQCGFGSNRITG